MSLKKLLLWLLSLAVLAGIALAVLGFVFLPRWVKQEAVKQARERGVELVPGDVSFSRGWVQLSNSQASLIGVRGLQASIGLADVELAGFRPARVRLAQVKANVVADPLVFLRELQSWYAAHSSKLTEPFSIQELELSLRNEAKAEPLILFESAALDYKPQSVALRVERASALGRNLGGARIAFDQDKLQVGVTLGQRSLDNPTLNLELREKAKPNLHLAFAPIPLGVLGQALQLPLPLPQVTLSGSVDANFPATGLLIGNIEGDVALALGGYLPPHPVELDGFVFGDTTNITAHFVVEPLKMLLRLESVGVTAGAFSLKGQGAVRNAERGPKLVLSLSGSLPCAALGSAAAETRLGRALGKLTGQAVRTTVMGAVGVHVAIDADLAAPEQARVLKSITPGCGLKPLTASELTALGELLPAALDPKVAQDLDTLLKQPLPSLPGLDKDTRINLPKLPTLPQGVLDLQNVLKPALSAKPATAKPAPTSSGGAASKPQQKNAAPQAE